MQNLLEDSSLKEGPRERLYQRSGWGAVFGSSLLLFAIASEILGRRTKVNVQNTSGRTHYDDVAVPNLLYLYLDVLFTVELQI